MVDREGRIVRVVATIACIVGLLTGGATAGPAGSGPISVIASFYPLYEFVQQVGGNRVRVTNLVPAGAEPHDYEPTPRDVIALYEARVLVYNGAGLEPWVQRLLSQIPASVVRVNASESLQLARSTAGDERGRTDPHVWLDPLLASKQVDAVLAGLTRADPDGSSMYASRAGAYKERLAALHDLYSRTLGGCRKKIFITSHAAFGYLAARYGLTQISISGLDPQAEPSASKIREVLRLIRQHDVRIVYYETLVSPRVANAIAREAGVRTLVLNPLEGLTEREIREGKTYITVMEQNLSNLREGLDCR